MTDDGWIVIPNWERFQHYGDRGPIWIKLYTELNSQDDYRGLTYSERGLLTSLWCEYARSNGQLRRADVSGRTGQHTRPRQLEALVQAGFIEISASKPLALRYKLASPRALAREEKKKSREEK